jgi:hypothetical protein
VLLPLASLLLVAGLTVDTLPQGSAAPKDAEPWVMETQPDGENANGLPRTRILTPQGGPISVGRGLEDAGLIARLHQRARARTQLADGLDPQWGQRAAVFVVAGLLGGFGVGALISGGVIVALSQVVKTPPSQLRTFVELPRVGPPLLLLGGTAVGVSGVSLTAGMAAALWQAWHPPPPDPAVLDPMSLSVWWDRTEAAEVVRIHNARLPQPQKGAPLPAGPAPETPGESQQPLPVASPPNTNTDDRPLVEQSTQADPGTTAPEVTPPAETAEKKKPEKRHGKKRPPRRSRP